MKKLLPATSVLIASAVLLLPFASSSVQAANVYWDNDANGANNNASSGAGLGSAGSWNSSLSGTPLVNWWSGSGVTDQSWVNANNDTAVFWGTAGTVSLTDNITAGGLLFNTTGYTISTGANTLTMAPGSTITLNNIAAATITGNITGTGAVTITRSSSAAGTLTLNGTSTGGWSGATTIANGAGLTLSGSNQALFNTSSIALSGNLTLINTSLTEAGLNRISDSAAITSTGGTFTVTNTVAASTPYAETIGAVGLSSGKLNIVSTNANTGGTEVLTLGGLTQSGTGTVAFSGGGGLNTGTNEINVTGATQTAAGQIISPWLTVGTAANAQTDYGVYDSSGNILAAGIAASAETTWTTAANAYTLNGGTTLTATRTITALEATGAAQTLNLGTFNLETDGILNAGTGALTITGPGVVRQNGTAAGNLYINTGSSSAPITINTVIANNTGKLTLVKTGTGTLILGNTSTYTGDTIVEEGTLTTPTYSTVLYVGGNLTVGSAGGGAAATFSSQNDYTNFNSSITSNVTVYSNGTFNFSNNSNSALAGLTIVGGTAYCAYGYISGPITMTGGTLGGTGGYYGPTSSVVTNASSTTATISIASQGYAYKDHTYAVARGTAAIDLNVTGQMNVSPGDNIFGIVKSGAGIMQVGYLNTFTGTTTINGGTLQAGIASTGANGAFGNNGAMVLANTAGVVLNLNGFNTTIGSLAGGGTTGGIVTLGSATLTTGGANTTTTFAGVISGAGGLTKVGSGIQTLTGSNTYTGGTKVSAGSLVYGNSFTMSGANAITVAATGTAGTNYATVSNTAGTLTFGGTLGITLTASLVGGESFTLFSASGGALAGDFGSTAGNVSITGSYVASLTNNGSGIWTGTDSSSGLNFTFATSGSNAGILSVSASAIPEPSAYAAIFGVLALAGAMAYHRRRSV